MAVQRLRKAGLRGQGITMSDWKKLDIPCERIKGGTYSSRIFISQREYLKVTNKLVKRDTYEGAYLLYKDGFEFDLFRIEYERFGKRYDVWQRKVTSDELEELFDRYEDEPPLPLPEVTGEPLEELVDD